MNPLANILWVVWDFIGEHWPALAVAAFVACLLVLVYRVLATRYGPGDFTGNGIVVGAPKNFDNRSLTMMLEQLDATLKSLNVVDQGVTKNLGSFQQQDSTSRESSAQFGFAEPEKAPKAVGDKEKSSGQKVAGDGRAADAATKPLGSTAGSALSFGLGAPDALADQLDLSYQIFNLRILNERSLSDRLYENGARMQVVLGFQISIDPPKGSEDCVAVVEIGLELQGETAPVSIVAMIPQEKTYNAASLSSKADSINGSVVARVLSVGGRTLRQEEHFYLHRDSDTIAFERDTRLESAAFGLRRRRLVPMPTVLGWEFRPVLGRRSVSPGTRQMLAVVALPCTDGQPRRLNVQSRGYWRSYDRRTQSSNVHWQWWPIPMRLGAVPPWSGASLTIDPPVEVEGKLGPKIKRISWVNAGAGVAVVLIEGRNFFSGTAVTIGGQVHRSAETNLTIKSDHALEVRTTVAALNEGEAVLSGRFGPTVPLVVNAAKLPTKSIYMESATFSVQPGDTYVRLAVTIRSADTESNQRVTKSDLEKLPDPILYLNGQPLFGAYDYDDCYSSRNPPPAAGQPDNRQKDAVQVQAWAQMAVFRGAGSVIAFKVPFCGEDWVASSVVRLPDGPSVSVMRTDAATSTLLISVPPSFRANWVATLDKEYKFGSPEFTAIDKQHLRLEVANKVLAEYAKLIVKNGDATTYLLDLAQAAPPPVARLNSMQVPPSVAAGKNAVCAWTGSNLTQVTAATIDGTAVPFFVHGAGGCVSVFVGEGTATPGKHEVSFAAKGGTTLATGFFVVDPVAEAAGA